jgi:hypothetical protein
MHLAGLKNSDFLPGAFGGDGASRPAPNVVGNQSDTEHGRTPGERESERRRLRGGELDTQSILVRSLF